jgi:hypothetical protein
MDYSPHGVDPCGEWVYLELLRFSDLLPPNGKVEGVMEG